MRDWSASIGPRSFVTLGKGPRDRSPADFSPMPPTENAVSQARAQHVADGGDAKGRPLIRAADFS